MRILVVLFFLLVSPSFTQAQLDSSFLNDSAPFLETQPDYPNPEDSITVTLNDYQSSNFGATIEWYIDGVLLTEAKNQRKITTNAGSVGQSSIIKAVMTGPTGRSEVASRTIRPIYLDIIVEPQTHVPDFYSGRALPSIGSIVNLTALLNDGSMVNSELIYTWRVNDQVIDAGPVRGRNKVSFTTPQGSSIILSLQVTRLDGTVLARRSLVIPSVSPEVVFYEMNTLYGLSSQAVRSNFNMSGNSATLMAEPYYLDSRVYNQPSLAEWKIDNYPAGSSGNNPYAITLERTGNPGIADLVFWLRNVPALLQ